MEGARRAIAGLTLGGEQSTWRFARHLLYVRSKSRGGRPAAIGRMSVGVQAKQVVHHLWTLCHKTANCFTMWTVREQTAPP